MAIKKSQVTWRSHQETITIEGQKLGMRIEINTTADFKS